MMGVVPAGTLLGLGLNTIEYTLTDDGGNSVTCSFTVTVEDNEDPEILNCPADPDPICGSGPVSWPAPTADDNCGIASFSSNYDPNDVFPVGSTEVTYTAVDNSGNTVTCTFTVVVHPVPAPALTATPEAVCASPSSSSGPVGSGYAAEGISMPWRYLPMAFLIPISTGRSPVATSSAVATMPCLWKWSGAQALTVPSR
ncbi:MAG: HYR domain-containing protein [Saprospirales bacterium]|nr:HYR domain-containing protein [Saprospirales bacterium]